MKMRLDTFKNRIKKQKGFTLLELLAVLIIIAILGMGLYFTLAKVQASSDANTEGKHIDLVTSAVKQLFAGSSNFGTKDLTPSVINSGAVPADLLATGGSTTSNGNTITNKWGGTITIAPDGVGGGTSNAFTITDIQIPQSVCVKLLSNTGNNYLVVTANGTQIRKYGDITPIDPTAAVTACNSQTNNSLTFTQQ